MRLFRPQPLPTIGGNLWKYEWNAMPDTGGKRPPGGSGWVKEKSRSEKFKTAGWRRPTDILKFMGTTTPFIFFATIQKHGNGI